MTMKTIMAASSSSLLATTTKTNNPNLLISQRQQRQKKKKGCFFYFLMKKRRLRRIHLYWILVSTCIVYLAGIQYSLNKLDYHLMDDDDDYDGNQLWESFKDIQEDLIWMMMGSSTSNSNSSSSDENEDDDTTIKMNEELELKKTKSKPRFVVAPDQLKLPKPIINVGFPKAGTSTIYDFFHCNGLKSQHWFCCEDDQDDPSGTTTGDNKSASEESSKLMSRCILDNMAQLNTNSTTQVKHIFDGCGEYDVYTEINGPRNFKDYKMRNLLDDGTIGDGFPRLLIPQHHYLQEIHDAFPNSTFILNKRPVKDWVSSVINWPTQLQIEIPREFFIQQQLYPNKFGYVYDKNFNTSTIAAKNKNSKNKNGGGFVMMKKLLINNTLSETLEVLYNFHNDIIRKFVKKYPSHTLVEIDISHNNTGHILANKFGLHSECWGHSNQNKHKNGGGKKGFKRKGKHRPRYQNNKGPMFGLMQGMKRGPGGIMIKPEEGDTDRDRIGGNDLNQFMEGIISANYQNKKNNSKIPVIDDTLQKLRNNNNNNHKLELLTSVDRHQRAEEIRQKVASQFRVNGQQRQSFGEQIAKFRAAHSSLAAAGDGGGSGQTTT